MGSREAVAGRVDRLAAEPGNVHVQAAGEELHRRAGVRVERERIGRLVTPDRDDARESPGEALDRHVVRRRDQHRALEICAVRELVQSVDVLLLRRRKAHVDDVEALGDRPFEAGEQHRRAARVAGSEHAHARQLALRCEQSDDPGARRAVTAEIAAVVVRDGDLVAFLRDGDRALHGPDERMVELDAAVEHAHAHARSGCVAERPLAVHALRPKRREVDRLARRGGKAPGWEVLVRFVSEH